MHLDRSWHLVLNKKYKSGEERPVELPYFIVFRQTIGQLEKGDTVKLCILREVKWAQTCVSTDSTATAAILLWQLLLCVFVPLCSTWPLCSVSSQGLCCYLGLYLSLFLLFLFSLSLSASPLSFGFESCKRITLSEFSPVIEVRRGCLEVFEME